MGLHKHKILDSCNVVQTITKISEQPDSFKVSRRDRVVNGAITIFFSEFKQLWNLVRDKEYRKTKEGIGAICLSAISGVLVVAGMHTIADPITGVLIGKSFALSPIYESLFFTGIGGQIAIHFAKKRHKHTFK